MTKPEVRTRSALLAGVLLALAVLVPSAAAFEPATVTIHLTADGPKPKQVTTYPGGKAVFVNDDSVPHQVKSQGGWQFDSGPIPPGRSSDPTPAFTATGTYRYSDVRGIVILPKTFAGSIVVKPTPTPTGSPTPTPTRSASPRPTVSPSGSPTPPPTSPAVPSTPTPTQVATPSPTASPGTAVLPSPPTASPTASPTPTTDLLYGDPQALVQPSPHRYGLPALLAGVAIGGVLSLLVRYLLALPEGRRTGV